MGRFLPLKADSNNVAYQAYNGTWFNVGLGLGAWLKANSSSPIATRIRAGSSYDIYYYYYYDLMNKRRTTWKK